MQVLCEVVKSGSAEQVQTELAGLLSILNILQESPVLSHNTALRKYKTKLVSRIGLRLLPGASNVRKKQGVRLFPSYLSWHESQTVIARVLVADATSNVVDVSDDIDVPEELEDILEKLFAALQDKVLPDGFRAEIPKSDARN